MYGIKRTNGHRVTHGTQTGSRVHGL